MLRLESYLSPFLLSYLSKYIKDIEAKNLQLSLWGGDVILHNLQFKLDALDNELGRAPFSFISCQAQELRIHVPWSKLTSESVGITLDRVECVIKLNCQKTLHKVTSVNKDDAASTSSYINTLMKKIKNNLSLNIKNLIIKYVEDDIVLSINLQTVTYQTVDKFWKPAFVDLTEEDCVLQKLLELKDMTVCLDKRGTNGRIESFENPMLFRTNFIFREHNVYATPASRKPLTTKINLLVDRYELNISENQLPMFLHLVQLCLHLYYGTIQLSFTEFNDSSYTDTSQQQGWASWAWSYVPPVLSYEIEENEMHDTVYAFGMYIKFIVVRFTPSRQNSTRQFHASQFQKTNTFLEFNVEGFQSEIVAKGLGFFSCVTSLCNVEVKYLGGYPKSSQGKAIFNTKDETSVLLAVGGKNLSHFSALSLFDFRSPENNNTLFEYPLTKEAFFNKNYLNKNDVFFSQYLYIATDVRSPSNENVDFNDYLRNANLNDISEWKNINEQSWKTFFIGGDSLHINISSHTLTCYDVLSSWASNHSIKPYPLAPLKPVVTPNILNNVPFIPTRSATIVFKNINISFVALFLNTKTYLNKTFCSVGPAKSHKSDFSNKVNVLLPAVTFSISKCEINTLYPMYSLHLASYLSQYKSPLSDHIHACNMQYNVQIPSLKIYLRPTPVLLVVKDILPLTLLPIVVLEQISVKADKLQGEKYWKKRITMVHTKLKLNIQKVLVSATIKQLEIAAHIIDSWLSLTQKDIECAYVLDVSEESQIFESKNVPLFKLAIQELVLEKNDSFGTSSTGGALLHCQMHWETSNSIIPILQFCNTVKPLHSAEDFLKPVDYKLKKLQKTQTFCWSSTTHVLSFYLQLSNESDQEGCLLINVHNLFLNLDPFMLDTLSSIPSITPSQLVPFFHSSFFIASTNSSTQFAVSKEPKLPFALQFRTHGGELFIPVKSHQCSYKKYEYFPAAYIVQESIKESQTGAVIFTFPSVSIFTSSFKPIDISSELLSKGVMMNKFTASNTLDFGFELASIFTVHCDGVSRLQSSNLIKPFDATCTLVLKQAIKSKYNLALHVDLDSVLVEFSKPQILLLIQVCNSVFHVISSIDKNCSAHLPPFLPEYPTSKENSALPPKMLHIAYSKTTDPTSTKTEEDLPSNAGRISPVVTVNQSLSFTLWLQCTLPQFMITWNLADKNKVSLFVDDVSFSLDYQSIYLKLMMSLSACNITYWNNINQNWQKNDFNGLLFSPMFSVLPSFVQKFDIDCDKNKTYKSGNSSKPGKFLDFTFTQALTYDYQQNIQEMVFDQESSSAVSTTTDTTASSSATISEIICNIQSFDIVINPKPLDCVIRMFLPLLQTKSIFATKITDSKPPLAFPMLYLTLAGARIFLPLDCSIHTADDVFMFCVGKIDINPHPQNLLSRLVVSTKIYKNAETTGLLHLPGSPLEDRQFEITLQDLSIGTTRSSNVIFHIKKKALHSDNPALQWNMLGKMDIDEPVFHPIVEQVDIKMLLAPSIYYLKSGNYILVCGPSLEINFISDLVLHVTVMQLSLVFNLCNGWTCWFKNLLKSMFESKSTSFSQFQNKQDKSSLTVVENSLSNTKLIKRNVNRLLSDNLITGKKLHVLVYNYYSEDRLNPLLQFEVYDPSFVLHVSRKEQKAVLQFYNAFASVGVANFETAAMIRDETNFPITLMETQQGEYNRRTGVPTSLCTATVNQFLSRQSSIKLNVDRPLKVYINNDIAACFKQIFLAFGTLEISSPTFPSSSSSSNTLLNFSCINLCTNQIVCEINHYNFKLRSCISEINAHTKTISTTILGNLTIKDFSVRLAYDNEVLCPLLYPVTIKADFKSDAYLIAKVSLGSVHFAFSCDLLNGIKVVFTEIQKWFSFCNKNSAQSFEVMDTETISINKTQVKKDDLRAGNYDFITTKCTEPLPGQIIFSMELPISTMTWCYEKPHTIRYVSIMPIPFNEILGDGSDILCVMESFCDITECYVAVKQFYISETSQIKFTLFDESLSFHEIIYATKWRVSVHNTHKCHVSPLSLAGSMYIEAIHEHHNLPNVAASLNLNSIKVTLSTGRFGKEIENAELKLSDSFSWLKVWYQSRNCLKSFTSFSFALHVVEYYSLTWLPVLFPVSSKINFLKVGNSSSCNFDVENVMEMHLSQRAIYSLQHLLSDFSGIETKNEPNFPIVVKNCTCETLVFGQALTDECIHLESGSITSYTWKTNKFDPNLHVNLDNMSPCTWSAPFSPYFTKKILCKLDKFHSFVAVIDRLNSHSSSITFKGCTKVFNYLDTNVQACFVSNGVTVYANCSPNSSSDKEFLFLLKDVSTVQFSLSNFCVDATSVIFANELNTPSESVKIIDFNVAGKVLQTQIFYYKENLVDVLAIMPIFVVRSYLPNSVILHVETRSAHASFTLPLEGSGNQVNLTSISPFDTHHLTIQLQENESPYDATVPIHYSLIQKLPLNTDLTICNHDIVEFYPFNSTIYDGTPDTNWSIAEGNIQAKLSRCMKSLLVEIVPWCLICNQTSMVFCLTSNDKNVTIVLPDQITTLHHFTGSFTVCTSNGSASDWINLVLNPEFEHPSRAEQQKLNYLPCNGFLPVSFGGGTYFAEILLHSAVHHGLRVITISPKWKFVNLSSHFKNCHILPCVDEHFFSCNHNEFVLTANFSSLVPILCWQSDIQSLSECNNKKIGDEQSSVSIASTFEKTSSSFFCIDQTNLSIPFFDRILCITCEELVALVSVKEVFTKKIIALHHISDRIVKKQMVLSHHEFKGSFYIILNDIKSEKYIFQNNTSLVLHIKEVVDDCFYNTTKMVINPHEQISYETFMETELFPLCKRNFCSIKLELCEEGSENWVELIINAQIYSDKVELSSEKLLYFTVSCENNQFTINFYDSSKLKHVQIAEQTCDFNLAINEVKLVCLDDVSNTLISMDIVQLLFDNICVKIKRKHINWLVELSLSNFQIDNQLYRESDFPIFLASLSKKQAAFISLNFFENFGLDQVDIAVDTVELHCEGEYLQILSTFLQSYIDLIHPSTESVRRFLYLPEEIENEVKVVMEPLRFQSLTIHPLTVFLSFRASITLSVYIDQGSINFSKFVSKNLDTTFHELVQEVMRHYFAEAVYGAGWVIGSVDLLGNPATTIRSYIKGISDFVVLPYQGLVNGPTAFVGGFARGITSLLLHFSAGTLRSVTNIAAGISRNLDYSSYTQNYNSQVYEFQLPVNTNFKISKSSAISKKPSYVSGVAKTLVGVVTKPIGNAAKLVSITGESILRRVSLEEVKVVRYNSTSHTTNIYKSSVTKYNLKIIRDSFLFPSQLSSLDCEIVCNNNIDFTATLVLSSKTLYIFQLVDDMLESALALSDIDINPEKSQNSEMVLNIDFVEPLKKNADYCYKVASYLGVESLENSSEVEPVKTVKYRAKVDSKSDADVFVSTFRIYKQNISKFEW